LSAYRGRILRLTTAVLHDPDLAEDAAQECFIKEFRAIRSFRGESSFYTWLSRIAMRACMDCLRRRRPGTEPETRGSGDCVSAGPAHASVERLAVEALLDRLTPALRAALVLRELDGLEYDEIAETLGIPVGTVRSRLHAARARFRELYAEASEEADSV
jgi:RNA polymerase sigma-70 factor (ECF subfamily)